MYDKGFECVVLLFILMVIGNMVVGNIVLCVGVKGICILIVIVCVSVIYLIGEVFCNIKYGYFDVIIVGGVEVFIIEIGILGFVFLIVLIKVIDLEKVLIFFDKECSGFVMGEGVGVFILELLDYVLEWGVIILGEVVGYGVNCDVYYMILLILDGSGVVKVMVLVMEEVGIFLEKIGYINVYGISI